MTITEGLAQDLEDIIDEATVLNGGIRPVFLEWATYEDVECRLYDIGNDTTVKLVVYENETSITRYFWADRCKN